MQKLYRVTVLVLGFFSPLVLAGVPSVDKSAASDSAVKISKFLKAASIPETPMGDSPWTETK